MLVTDENAAPDTENTRDDSDTFEDLISFTEPAVSEWKSPEVISDNLVDGVLPAALATPAMTGNTGVKLTSLRKSVGCSYTQPPPERRPKLTPKQDAKLRADDPDTWNAPRQSMMQNFVQQRRAKKQEARTLKRESTIKKLVENTAEVDGVLAEFGSWPLAVEYSQIMSKVARGETFYPKDPKWPPHDKRKFQYPSEILDHSGLPVKVSDFCYDIFAPLFLAKNHTKMKNIVEKDVAAAFRFCVTMFYAHTHWAHQEMFDTVPDGDESNLEAVKMEVIKSLKYHAKCNSAEKRINDGSVDKISDDIPQEKRLSNIPAAKQLSNNSADELLSDNFKEKQLSDIPQEKPLSDNPAENLLSENPAEKRQSADTPMAMVTSHHEQDALYIGMKLFEEELLLNKYFPPREDITVYRPCLRCAETGHSYSDCHGRLCSICGSGHSDTNCPKMRRCERCLERGHSSVECSEKLACRRSEVVCDLCDVKGHVESECHFIWRSFHPKPEEIRKVQSIETHCYCCGASGHYGSECGLDHGLNLSGTVTWSRDNLRSYIDSLTESRAVSARVDYSISSNKGFGIKGKARGFTVVNEDSDDAKDFIRPKIFKTERGSIHIRPQRSHEYRSGLGNFEADSMRDDIYSTNPDGGACYSSEQNQIYSDGRQLEGFSRPSQGTIGLSNRVSKPSNRDHGSRVGRAQRNTPPAFNFMRTREIGAYKRRALKCTRVENYKSPLGR